MAYLLPKSRHPMSDPYIELEEAWMAGEMTHAEACAIAEEMGYGDE